MSIGSKIKVFKEVNKNLPLIVFDMAILNESIILSMNQDQLENKGVREDGTQITPGYTPRTIELKREKGQRVDHVTLRDTGDFYRGMKLVFNYQDDYFYLWSDDPKTAKILTKYNKDGSVLGLIDSNLQRIINIIRPQITNVIREKLIYA